MASNNAISVDPRIVTPLACCPDDGLARFPRDTLHRVAITLTLYAELVGGHNGESDLLGSDNMRFALSLQLTGLADLVAAVSDALAERNAALRPGEIPVALDREELEKLQILAGRRGVSVCDVAQGILAQHLRGVRPDGAANN